MIPLMTDPLGRHWDQPRDIREAPMDDKHVLLTARQIAGLCDYSRSYPSGIYDGKCWKRYGEDQDQGHFWYLCWYQPHAEPGKIGIDFRIILNVDEKGNT
jgi:hypothetical protein